MCFTCYHFRACESDACKLSDSLSISYLTALADVFHDTFFVYGRSLSLVRCKNLTLVVTVDNNNLTCNGVKSNVFACSVNVVTSLSNDLKSYLCRLALSISCEYEVCKNAVSNYVSYYVVLEVESDLTLNVCVDDYVISSEDIAVGSLNKCKDRCIICDNELTDEETGVVIDSYGNVSVLALNYCSCTNSNSALFESGDDNVHSVCKLCESLILPYLTTVIAVPVLDVTVSLVCRSEVINVVEILRTYSRKNYVLDVCKLCESLICPNLLTLVADPVLNVTLVVAVCLYSDHMNEEVGALSGDDNVLTVCDLSSIRVSEYCIAACAVPVLSVTCVVTACFNCWSVLELVYVHGRLGLNCCLTCESDGTIVKRVRKDLCHCCGERRIVEIADHVSVLCTCSDTDIPAVAGLSTFGKCECYGSVVTVLCDALVIRGSLEVYACELEVLVFPVKALLLECERSCCAKKVVRISCNKVCKIYVEVTEGEATCGNDLTLVDCSYSNLGGVEEEESVGPEAVGVNICIVAADAYLKCYGILLSGNSDIFNADSEVLKALLLNVDHFDVTVVKCCCEGLGVGISRNVVNGVTAVVTNGAVCIGADLDVPSVTCCSILRKLEGDVSEETVIKNHCVPSGRLEVDNSKLYAVCSVGVVTNVVKAVDRVVYALVANCCVIIVLSLSKLISDVKVNSTVSYAHKLGVSKEVAVLVLNYGKLFRICDERSESPDTYREVLSGVTVELKTNVSSICSFCIYCCTCEVYCEVVEGLNLEDRCVGIFGLCSNCLSVCHGIDRNFVAFSIICLSYDHTDLIGHICRESTVSRRDGNCTKSTCVSIGERITCLCIIAVNCKISRITC